MFFHLYVDKVEESYRKSLKSGISWASPKSTRLCKLCFGSWNHFSFGNPLNIPGKLWEHKWMIVSCCVYSNVHDDVGRSTTRPARWWIAPVMLLVVPFKKILLPVICCMSFGGIDPQSQRLPCCVCRLEEIIVVSLVFGEQTAQLSLESCFFVG